MWAQTAFMPWVQVPAEGLVDTLRQMSWKKPQDGSAAQDLAALMIYVVLLFSQTERVLAATGPTGETLGIPLPITERLAAVTYDDLEQATGMSRSLVRQGLSRLIELGKIRATGSRQKRAYVLKWAPGRWFKLPCREIAKRDGINAFKTFTLRTKHELNALKLYLYLADVRDRNNLYTEVSYEVISDRLGIPERDIRRAINVLTAAGLLARVHRESDRLVSSWGPNQYYLAGYADLIDRSTNRGAVA